MKQRCKDSAGLNPDLSKKGSGWRAEVRVHARAYSQHSFWLLMKWKTFMLSSGDEEDCLNLNLWFSSRLWGLQPHGVRELQPCVTSLVIHDVLGSLLIISHRWRLSSWKHVLIFNVPQITQSVHGIILVFGQFELKHCWAALIKQFEPRTNGAERCWNNMISVHREVKLLTDLLKSDISSLWCTLKKLSF